MSKTVKFEIGDRVLTIIDSKMYKGTIQKLHLDLPRPVAIIDLDDGTKGKVYITDIIPEPKESKEVKEEPEKVQEEPKREPVEKESITITPAEFEDIASDVDAKIVSKTNRPSLALLFGILISELHMALFYDAVEND